MSRNLCLQGSYQQVCVCRPPSIHNNTKPDSAPRLYDYYRSLTSPLSSSSSPSAAILPAVPTTVSVQLEDHSNDGRGLRRHSRRSRTLLDGWMVDTGGRGGGRLCLYISEGEVTKCLQERHVFGHCLLSETLVITAH